VRCPYDRTHYFLCVGANPAVSNGSFMTAPDVRRRLRTVRERGGRIVVVDPRRTETAREADQCVPIRPGGDAALLLAMTQTLVAAGRVDETSIAAVAHGWPQVRERLKSFTPERVTAPTGVAPETIRSLAHEFADAPSSVAYSRVGVCNSRFGTLGTWATDVLNLAAGRLGAVGGAVPDPADRDAAVAHLPSACPGLAQPACAGSRCRPLPPAAGGSNAGRRAGPRAFRLRQPGPLGTQRRLSRAGEARVHGRGRVYVGRDRHPVICRRPGPSPRTI
jgi:anaerobic selenocysteine-containing dehydrogenase